MVLLSAIRFSSLSLQYKSRLCFCATVAHSKKGCARRDTKWESFPLGQNTMFALIAITFGETNLSHGYPLYRIILPFSSKWHLAI